MSLEKFVFKVSLFLLAAMLFNYPMMWLMNYVFASNVLLVVFGTPHMTFWKTFAVGVLTGLLFRRGQ